MSETGEESPAQWAIDLLTKDTGYAESAVTRYFPEATCGIIGFGSMLVMQLISRKPLQKAIPMYAISTLAGITIGAVVSKVTKEYDARRDGIYLDYVKRHPERFPEPDYVKKTYAEVFHPWNPIR